MRYQERIYIQNDNSAVRNKDILNVNMSSDMCIFEAPQYNVSGATKLDCSGSTGTTYIITSATTIPLTFQFTANTETFSATSATFKYEIYKYDNIKSQFHIPPIYKSGSIDFASFSATSATTQYIPVSGLSIDGEYLIKGYYNYTICTNFLNLLGKTVDTLSYRTSNPYDLYDNDLDFYFIAVKSADIPQLFNTGSNQPSSSTLFQQVILPIPGTTNVVITSLLGGDFILTLNGLVLAPNLDYTFIGNIVTLSASTVIDDIITIIYTASAGPSFIGDNINVTTPVISGITNGQGTNTVYFDTTTGKYELYTSVTPSLGADILVMINGATLANGIDYYQSISNPKRIILEGDIQVGDIITIVYFPMTSVVNGIITNIVSIGWSIATPPQLVNGFFTLEISTGDTFSTLYSSITSNYIINNTTYTQSFIAYGPIGSTLYYRVKNEKNFITICGDIITTIAYSEIIPLIIQTNSINSY